MRGLFSVLLAAILTSFLLVGCGFYRSKQSSNFSPRLEQELKLAQAIYSDVRKFVIRPSCLECHSSVNPKGGVSLETEAEVYAALSAFRRTVLSERSMPPRQALSAAQIQLVSDWFDRGNPRVVVNEPVPPPSPTPTPELKATYESIRELVFVPKCLRCHRPEGTAEEFPLDDYAAMMKAPEMVVPGDPQASTVFQSVDEGWMPPRRSDVPAATAEEVQKIREWIQEGAAEK